MKRIDSIQLLRVFAAISVVLVHMSFIASGHYGVDIFFVISGFLMMYSTEKGLCRYWKKKFIRIVPFYWFMTIVTSVAVVTMPNLFNSYEFSWIYMAKSLLFIPYTHNGISQPILGLGYTLNYEMWFYLIFYIASAVSGKFAYKLRGAFCIGIIAILVFIGACFDLPMPFSLWCGELMLEFAEGIMMYYFVRAVRVDKCAENMTVAWKCICTACIIVAVCVLWNTGQYAKGFMRIWLWGGISLILFLAVYMLFYEKKICRPLLYIGNASYYIYLTHPYCVRLTEKIVFKIIGENICGKSIVVIIGVTGSVLIGCIINMIISRLINNKRKTITQC